MVGFWAGPRANLNFRGMPGRGKGSSESNSFDGLQNDIYPLAVWAPECTFVIRKLLKHVLCRVDSLVLADAYPESVKVGGSESGYDTLNAVMAIGRSSEPPRYDVELVSERVVDDDQPLGCVGSLAKDLLDGGAGHVHEGFYDKERLRRDKLSGLERART